MQGQGSEEGLEEEFGERERGGEREEVEEVIFFFLLFLFFFLFSPLLSVHLPCVFFFVCCFLIL